MTVTLEAATGPQPGPDPSSPPRPRGATWRRLRQDKAAATGMVIITLMVLVAVLAPLLTALEGQDTTTEHPELVDSASGGTPLGSLGGVSAAHWLGVEPQTGRDLFARLVYGARISLGVALGATALQVLIGVSVGIAAGLGGRFVDSALSRLTDLTLAFPSVLFAIGLMAIVPGSVPRPLVLAVVIALLGWGATARLARGQTLSLRTRDYVAAAKLSGAPPLRVARREILPGLVTPIITYAALLVPTNMISEAGLSFLGVGVRPPTPSWGQMLSAGTTWCRPDVMYVLVPGGALFLTLLAFTLLADGVRRTLDPRNTEVAA
ncbi:ABC transporter permease [Catenulispora sp. NF23]|uniref:ABC transporter permease n=1 Tax=Catenulispora pinistramenti TaxID=2705254 RepID=UPI001BA99AF7|nr:ABC transporter permease [Catenulispora pinistramenti]MBS2539054.1 ABC transporter permease [Catenulispora pinistramenti]